jgi:hypothetical protein
MLQRKGELLHLFRFIRRNVFSSNVDVVVVVVVVVVRYVADMDKILEAQHRAQDKSIARKTRRQKEKQELLSRLRGAFETIALVMISKFFLITTNSYAHRIKQTMTDAEVVDMSVSVLYFATKTPWPQLLALPLQQVCDSVVPHINKNKAL